MAITNDSSLKAAYGAGPYYRALFSKASVSTQIVGGYTSLWKSATLPIAAATPSTAAVCDDALSGAFVLPTKNAGATIYCAGYTITPSVAQGVYLFDRLAHMGGLSGTVTTAQTVGVSVSTLMGTRCASDCSDVEWFLEWYTATGSTAVTATVAATYHDDSTGNISVSIPASTAAQRAIPILPAVYGKYIKSIGAGVTLSATTGTAGSFGVTAGKRLCSMMADTPNLLRKGDWANSELIQVSDSSCLWFMSIPTNATTGTIFGDVLLIQA
jgi:hypothetical protein